MSNNNKWICEECGEPIHRSGYSLFCENGCFEDDVRNSGSSDLDDFPSEK